MFSTNQMDIAQPLVEQMYSLGYEYYICIANTNINNTDQYNFYDLTFYFSDTEIIKSGNRYTCSGNYKKIDYMTRNVSTSYNQNDPKVERLKSTISNKFDVTLPTYEHIYTNAINSEMPNFVALTEYANEVDVTRNLTINDTLVPSVLLGVIVLMTWFKMWFARGYNNE